MSDYSFYAVVVIYNKNLSKSITISNLINCSIDKLEIVVVDNSSDSNLAIDNEKSAEALNLKYISMKGNKGLSKAYNRALDFIENKKRNDIVIWLDDDTHINKDYFDALNNAVKNEAYQVFMPIVYGQNGIIYSPNEAGLLKSKLIASLEEAKNIKNYNGINSCLALRLNIYNNYRYDERLFMDAVDNKLFDDLREQNVRFYVLPAEIHQNFFQRAKDVTVEKLWFRFENRIKDTMIYCDRNIRYNFIGLIRSCGWGVVNGIKVKSLRFTIKCIMLGSRLFLRNCASLLNKKIELKY